MTAPKKPQDHQAKKPRVKAVEGGKSVTFPDIMTKGADGKVVKVDDKPVPLSVTILDVVLDDFELLDDLAVLESKNLARLPSVLRRLVGDQFPTVMASLRGENGRISVDDGAKFVMELLEELDPNS